MFVVFLEKDNDLGELLKHKIYACQEGQLVQGFIYANLVSSYVELLTYLPE